MQNLPYFACFLAKSDVLQEKEGKNFKNVALYFIIVCQKFHIFQSFQVQHQLTFQLSHCIRELLEKCCATILLFLKQKVVRQ